MRLILVDRIRVSRADLACAGISTCNQCRCIRSNNKGSAQRSFYGGK